MKNILKLILFVFLAAIVPVSCQKDEPDVPVFPDRPDNPDEPVVPSLEPAACSNNVVAHRCGGKEAGAPENSIQALKYTMKLGCLAAECDIYWTKDNNVIVHHGSDGLVNGIHPSQYTLAEIRAKGKLSNGEDIPTLEDFLKVLCVKGNCTKLWIETKNITNKDLTSAEQETAIINGFSRAVEIIKEMKAEKFVEFNGTGRSAVFKKIYPAAKSAGFTMSYPTTETASSMKSNNRNWANYDVSSLDASQIDAVVADYKANGITLSMYCIDSGPLQSAVKPHKGSVKALMTNYPKALIDYLK